jgi:hypothetical protein
MKPPRKPTTPKADEQPPAQGMAHDRLLKLYEKTKSGQLPKIGAEGGFGGEWNKVRVEIKATPGQTIERYARNHKLPFSVQYANGCGRLANVFGDFQPAHDWYEQSGKEDGWRTKKNSGWEYALEVIGFHKRSKDGESPESANKTPKPKKPKGGASETMEALKQALDDREKALDEREKALAEREKALAELEQIAEAKAEATLDAVPVHDIQHGTPQYEQVPLQ